MNWQKLLAKKNVTVKVAAPETRAETEDSAPVTPTASEEDATVAPGDAMDEVDDTPEGEAKNEDEAEDAAGGAALKMDVEAPGDEANDDEDFEIIATESERSDVDSDNDDASSFVEHDTPPVTPAMVPRSHRVVAHDGRSKSSNSVRAGLQFPVGRVKRFIRNAVQVPRVNTESAVYFAAVLEYLVAEVLELAGNATKDGKHKRMTPVDIASAIEDDDELRKLCKGMVMKGAPNAMIQRMQKAK